MVVKNAFLTPKASFTSRIAGAMQLVVQELALTIFSPVYLWWLTP
jgi:hypothetical protein